MKIALPHDAAPLPPLPSPAQLSWQRGELAIFVCFTVNTYTGKEWGDGTESPAIFNPVQLDAHQWARAAKAAGARHMILTAKHHDGFCLWPSKYTDHCVKNSPWRGGKGDVVREFVDACRAHGLLPGLYLSPWDRHEQSYGDSPRYNAHYLAQLGELLTNYGELAEIWFDGVCAEGPNGKKQVYDWPAYFALCKQLQPKAVTFGDGGTDVRWIGNELGFAGEPCWGMVNSGLVRFPGDVIGKGQTPEAVAHKMRQYHELYHGSMEGDVWRPGESDVSIRPGWFYHPEEDPSVRSVENLVDLYFRSVGRNSLMLLNVPPTPAGLIHATDVDRMAKFRARLDQIFAQDLTAGATANAVDPRRLEIHFAHPQTFDVIDLREAIELGQRVAGYRISYRGLDGQWAWLVEGNTIGHRKLERLTDPVTASAIQIETLRTRGKSVPLLSEVGLYRSR